NALPVDKLFPDLRDFTMSSGNFVSLSSSHVEMTSLQHRKLTRFLLPQLYLKLNDAIIDQFLLLSEIFPSCPSLDFRDGVLTNLLWLDENINIAPKLPET